MTYMWDMLWLDSLDIFFWTIFFSDNLLLSLQNVFNPQKNEDKRNFSDDQTYYKVRINKILISISVCIL